MFDHHAQQAMEQLDTWWRRNSSGPLVAGRITPSDIPHTDDLLRYWTDVDFILDRWMSIVERSSWLGVAVPFHYIDFGACAMPCSMGGRCEYLNHDTVYSHPVCESLAEVRAMRPSREHLPYRAQMDATRRSVALAGQHHFVSPWAFGGLLDTLGGLYDCSRMLVDLVMHPREIHDTLDALNDIWLSEAAEDFAMIAESGNPGHVCCWTGIWAPGTTFPVQEDTAYMISPEMFREFCLPRIRKQIDFLEYPLFHLDGTGMLPHLDALLEIETLPAIQWQPGAGKEALEPWYPVIRSIKEAGKSCQVFGCVEEIPSLVNAVGGDNLLILLRDPEAVSPGGIERIDPVAN